MRILFYGLSATEGLPGQAGWTHSLPFWYSKNRNASVYLLCSLGDIYKVVDDRLVKKTTQDIEDIPFFDILFARSNYTYHNSIKNFFSKFKYKIIYQCGFDLNMPHFKEYDLIIKESDIFKPIPNSSYFFPTNQEKKYISIIGSILKRKRILELAKELDPEIIKDYTIFLCGKNKEPHVLGEFKRILDSKKIKYTIPSSVYISHTELAKYINKSLCILHPSELDYNPRSIIEVLLCDIPFIITPQTQLNDEYYKYGYCVNLNKFNSTINDLKSNPNKATGFRDKYVDKHTHEYFFNIIEKEYENFCKRT